MRPNLLILGGTTEGRSLCHAVAGAGLSGIVSLAGRVERPASQALPMRMGGFGGAEGLERYLRDNGITHVIDATHPFAVQMSCNAIAACERIGVPLIALTRAPWSAEPGDRWTHVPDIAGAVAALDCSPKHVMLAVGRMHLHDFTANPQHAYLLRLVDPPKVPLGFPDAQVIVDRGPFTLEGDRALMVEHRIDLVVSKNAGGTGAQAKILAARELGLPVLMIDRPTIPERAEAHSVANVMRWLGHVSTDLGV
ncbi:cobalt-precorrin-6A reductase [Aquicoccus porphyridii]|uniref:Cobalt-precorrin-6A reductase n=1 Tax=Aquicoccus porphyridii TaxID=1852029 RepID=A0A5A9Z4T3_9RHOB|nr:cobalt-precorrin-6A reductase [Aquicoccus porphyridii]KAA0912191.1 cobalt-precorrin-6A reductase [Aquicoccus porphyridii]RAI52957.1 cobalt-precorrin-6A reductase [Rhodobacteraceae bacterium AsT-22]